MFHKLHKYSGKPHGSYEKRILIAIQAASSYCRNSPKSHAWEVPASEVKPVETGSGGQALKAALRWAVSFQPSPLPLLFQIRGQTMEPHPGGQSLWAWQQTEPRAEATRHSSPGANAVQQIQYRFPPGTPFCPCAPCQFSHQENGHVPYARMAVAARTN